VHAAAPTAIDPDGLPPDFGERLFHRYTLRQRMAMAAVSAGDVVLLREMRADTRRHGFFANIEVNEARHDPGPIGLLNAQFELAHHLHDAVKRAEGITRQRSCHGVDNW
jgi:hypothetical protein